MGNGNSVTARQLQQLGGQIVGPSAAEALGQEKVEEKYSCDDCGNPGEGGGTVSIGDDLGMIHHTVCLHCKKPMHIRFGPRQSTHMIDHMVSPKGMKMIEKTAANMGLTGKGFWDSLIKTGTTLVQQYGPKLVEEGLKHGTNFLANKVEGKYGSTAADVIRKGGNFAGAVAKRKLSGGSTSGWTDFLSDNLSDPRFEGWSHGEKMRALGEEWRSEHGGSIYSAGDRGGGSIYSAGDRGGALEDIELGPSEIDVRKFGYDPTESMAKRKAALKKAVAKYGNLPVSEGLYALYEMSSEDPTIESDYSDFNEIVGSGMRPHTGRHAHFAHERRSRGGSVDGDSDSDWDSDSDDEESGGTISGWSNYISQNRKDYKGESQGDAMRKLGAAWKKLTPKQKEKYAVKGDQKLRPKKSKSKSPTRKSRSESPKGKGMDSDDEEGGSVSGWSNYLHKNLGKEEFEGMPHGEVMRELGARWRKLTPEKKALHHRGSHPLNKPRPKSPSRSKSPKGKGMDSDDEESGGTISGWTNYLSARRGNKEFEGMSQGDVMRELGARWRELTPKQKDKYSPARNPRPQNRPKSKSPKGKGMDSDDEEGEGMYSTFASSYHEARKKAGKGRATREQIQNAYKKQYPRGSPQWKKLRKDYQDELSEKYPEGTSSREGFTKKAVDNQAEYLKFKTKNKGKGYTRDQLTVLRHQEKPKGSRPTPAYRRIVDEGRLSGILASL
jgi:hypothetical protein